jgi:dihydrodipicolinate synthase/N-acetylneuraminate lyase
MQCLRGEIEAETARRLFAAFAEKHDLLASETNVIAVRAAAKLDNCSHIAANACL